MFPVCVVVYIGSPPATYSANFVNGPIMGLGGALIYPKSVQLNPTGAKL